MYNEESDDGTGSDSSDFSSVPVRKKRNKTKELTWAEAAEIVSFTLILCLLSIQNLKQSASLATIWFRD